MLQSILLIGSLCHCALFSSTVEGELRLMRGGGLKVSLIRCRHLQRSNFNTLVQSRGKTHLYELTSITCHFLCSVSPHQ